MKTFSTTPNIARAADQAVTWLCGHQFLQATYWEPASKLYRSGGSKWGLHDSTRVEGVAREGGHHREWWAGVIVGWSVQGIVSDPLWLAAAAEVQDFCLQDFWFSFNFADNTIALLLLWLSCFNDDGPWWLSGSLTGWWWAKQPITFASKKTQLAKEDAGPGQGEGERQRWPWLWAHS